MCGIESSDDMPPMAATPLGLGELFSSVTQGSACAATLGYAPKSLWDSTMDAIVSANFACADSSFNLQPSSFYPA
jgi:hypothetical protein